MVHEAKSDELEYAGYKTTIRTKGWWCSSCGDGVLEANALKASERAFLDLQAKVACLASFLGHEKYGGILIWTSIHPDTVNRFEHYP
jgi:YgiT-type zinc finger domain-containing protein